MELKTKIHSSLSSKQTTTGLSHRTYFHFHLSEWTCLFQLFLSYWNFWFTISKQSWNRKKYLDSKSRETFNGISPVLNCQLIVNQITAATADCLFLRFSECVKHEWKGLLVAMVLKRMIWKAQYWFFCSNADRFSGSPVYIIFSKKNR